MKAITIIQPWPYAILHLGKRIENRSWQPRQLEVGERFALHAGSKLDHGAIRDLRIDMRVDHLALGAVVGVATFMGTLGSIDACPRSQLRWWSGPLGWLLDDVVPCDPVPVSGALGLWTLPEAIAARVWLGTLAA